MGTRDSLVEALRRLCDQEGGHSAVADAAGVSADNLWQILKGIKLPSGEPRGVGPRLARKLDEAYPGWADAQADSSKPSQTKQSQQALLAAALESMARSIAARSRLERRQLEVLLPLLASDPDNRQETCEAIMRLLAPGQEYTYTATWEEAAAEVERELGPKAKLTARELIDAVEAARIKPVQPASPLLSRTTTHR